jgi:hypothetical protein
MIIEQINTSCIAYNPQHDIHVREYYLYCVSLIKEQLAKHIDGLNIILGSYNVVFPNLNKTIRIDLQIEHTLVKEGGRSVDQLIYGTVKYGDNKNYLIRIPNYNYYNSLDYVIEYSQPNIHNISTNSAFDTYLEKVLHIYPTLYDTQHTNVDRNSVVFLCSGWNARRNNLLNSLQSIGIDIMSVENCYDKNCICDLYSKTRILVNVHQTDYHDTFEELRVLPALLNGTIVVSEDVPLKDQIMYSDCIVWASYEDLPAKVLDVINNYDKYYNDIFGNDKIKEYIDRMKINNHKTISLIK